MKTIALQSAVAMVPTRETREAAAGWKCRSCALLLEHSPGLRAQHTQSMAGDHQLLVGGNDVAGDARSLARDRPLALCIAFGVKFKAEPRQTLPCCLANCRGVLADSGGEDEAVYAAHG